MKKIRYTLTLAFIFVMFLAADLLKNEAVIFPEMLAILIGCVCTDKLPWKTDNIHTFIMMTISAAAGFAISAFVPFPLYIKVLIGFVFPGLLIILTDCTMMPCLSACLLPIYMGETSAAYPIAVSLMTAGAVTIRQILINCGNKEASFKFHYTPDFAYDLGLWSRMFIIFAVLAAVPMVLFGFIKKYIPIDIPIDSEIIFLLAPPLVVTFVEGYCRNMRGRRFRIWFVISVAAVTGALLRFIGVDLFGISQCVPAVIAAGITLLEMRLMNIMFPPAGAIALLPFITEGNVFMYPLLVSFGCIAVLAVSSMLGVGRSKE
ncbi:MAG: hypothetical protein Q4G33_05780 [bacterium]|nr:hypothetical protein [bacterium]